MDLDKHLSTVIGPISKSKIKAKLALRVVKGVHWFDRFTKEIDGGF